MALIERLFDRFLARLGWEIRSFITGCIVSTIMLCVICCGGTAMTVYITGATTAKVFETMPEAEPEKVWTGDEPVVCSGIDAFTVEGVSFDLPDSTAVIAKGNCELTLIDVSIVAATGIEASGNAEVSVKGGRVEGSDHAVEAAANAVVVFDGTDVAGEITTKASSTVTGAE